MTKTPYTLPGIDLTTLRLQTFDDSKKRPGLAKHFEYDEEMAQALQKAGAGLYWCLNPGHRTIASTTEIRRVALDLDVNKEGSKMSLSDIEIAKADLAATLYELPIPPSALIETKNGLQPYWILDTPIELADEEARKDFNSHQYKQLLLGLNQAIGVKNERPDICGVFRLPGSLHLKDPKTPFEIKVTGDGSPVSTKEFFETYTLKEKEEPKAQAAEESVSAEDDNSYLSVPVVDFLTKLSGDPIVNGEVYEFTANNKETLNIIVNGKETGQWIDLKQNTIGSAKGGASVTIANWIAYYGVLDKDQAVAWLDKAMGKLSEDELEAASLAMVHRFRQSHLPATLLQIEEISSLLSETMPPEEWLIDKVLPINAICVITGAPATFKSFFSLTMAQSLRTLSPWLNRYEVKSPVSTLIIDKENGRRRFHKRCRGLGMTGDSIYRVSNPEIFKLGNVTTQLSPIALEASEFVKKEGIGFVIIDSMVDLIEGDENTAGDTQTFFNNIRYLFPNSTVFIIHHEGKDTKNEKSRMDKSRGSSNIPSQVDVMFRVERVKDVPNLVKFMHSKSRDTEEMTPIIVKVNVAPDPQAEGTTIVSSLAFESELEELVSQEKLSAEEIILQLLPEESGIPLLKDRIVQECQLRGINEETVNDVISLLKFKNLLVSARMGKGFGGKKKYFRPVQTVSEISNDYTHKNED